MEWGTEGQKEGVYPRRWGNVRTVGAVRETQVSRRVGGGQWKDVDTWMVGVWLGGGRRGWYGVDAGVV